MTYSSRRENWIVPVEMQRLENVVVVDGYAIGNPGGRVQAFIDEFANPRSHRPQFGAHLDLANASEEKGRGLVGFLESWGPLGPDIANKTPKSLAKAISSRPNAVVVSSEAFWTIQQELRRVLEITAALQRRDVSRLRNLLHARITSRDEDLLNRAQVSIATDVSNRIARIGEKVDPAISSGGLEFRGDPAFALTFPAGKGGSPTGRYFVRHRQVTNLLDLCHLLLSYDLTLGRSFRRCEKCGRFFVPARGTARFCERRCSDQARSARYYLKTRRGKTRTKNH